MPSETFSWRRGHLHRRRSVEFQRPLLESNEQPNELPNAPPPAAIIPTFVNFPLGSTDHQRPLSPNSDSSQSSFISDLDLALQSISMSDNEPEVVDLTTSTPRRRAAIPVSSSPPTAFDPSPPFHRGQPGPSRGVKRRNDEQGESSASASARLHNTPITMDLTEMTTSEPAIQGPSQAKRLRQTDSGIASGHITHSENATHPRPTGPDANDSSQTSNPLLAYRCPICLDTPSCWTSSVCGHLFCHQCIYEHLEFSSRNENGDSSKKSKGTCPVCRTPISRNDKGKSRGVVPVIFQTRKRDGPAPTS